ncbi:MAG: PAS domain S-box protein [Bryobacteraceae bacterium]|jgi:PAS domain S-box-containing protein
MVLPREVEVLLPALASLPLAALITDSNGVVSWANAGLSDLTGYSVDEIVGQSVGMLESKHSTHPIHDSLQHVASGEPWEADSIWSRKNGKTCAVLIAVTPIKDTTGCTTHSLWVITNCTRAEENITEHKRAEDAVHQAQANLSALIESTEDLIWSVDLNYTLQVCNKAFRDNIEHNYSIRAAAGMRSEDLLPPARAVQWPPMYERALSDGAFRVEHLLLDGRTLEMSFNPIRQDGRTTGVSVFGKDITERKIAERTLREAESEYRNIYEGAIEGIYRTSIGGRALGANPALAKLLGYDSVEQYMTEMTDSGHQEWLDPDERSRYLHLLEERDVIRGHECQLRRRDGTPIWVSLNSRRVCGEDGQVLYIEGFVEDIAARKTAENERRQSDKRYKSLFDSMNEGVALHKLLHSNRTPQNYILLEVNRRYEEILGMKREQVVDKLATEVYGTQDAPYLPEYASVVKTGTPVQFETYFPPMDKRFIISVAPMGDDLFATIFFDITEQRKAEDLYKLLSENAADVIWLWDLANGRCTYVSPSVRHLRGFTPEELMAQSMDDAMPSDAYGMVVAETQNRIAAVESGDEGARIRTDEVTYLRKDGTTVDTETVTKLLSDESGTVRHVLGISRDITERKRAQEEKAKLENDLRQAQKLESVGRLAGGVAHDFNNLLTVINGYSDLVLKRLKAPDLLRSYVEEIKKAGERAASVTKQLLAFSRKQMIEPRMLDLNTTIQDVVPILQSVVGEGIALQLHLDNSLGQVMADPNQVHQVLMNLLVNARDAMPEGGKLEITTRNVDLDEDSAASHPEASAGRYILMTVTDSGHGMDEATCQHLFEPFFTTKESSKGTGLGLATVYGIIKQSDGWIDVRSEVGVGTSFMVYLPRMDGRPLVEENGIAAATEGGGETILLVEDQEAVRSLAKAALRQHGYQVLEALDGAEAIAVAKRYSGEIHLLLTDVVMPGMNGKELSERLIAMRPGLKVLFVSGYTANVIAHGGVIDHDIAYMAKPFSPDGLAAKVRKVLAAPAKPTVGT